MQLGSVLSSDIGTPVVGRDVEFHLLRPKGLEGKQTRVRCKATLLFVPEHDRRQSKRAAAEAMRLEYGDKPVPEDEQRNEEQIRFLAQALHDSDNLAAKFIDGNNFEQFKAGLVPAVTNWLMLEYLDLLKVEYPECIDPEERRRLEAEAEKNSDAGQH